MSSSSSPGNGGVLLRVLGVATAAVGALAMLTTIKRQTRGAAGKASVEAVHANGRNVGD